MADIYVYDRSGDDTSTTGLVGALIPISCEHEEIGNGMSAVEMVHPYDEWGKWKALISGNILSVPVRLRTTPGIDQNGLYVTSVEKWTVKAGATKTQRIVYAKEKKNKKKGTLIAGRTVVVLKKSKERYQVQYEKYDKRKKRYTWLTGWVIFEALDYDETETIENDAGGIEALCPSGDARPQLFRIQSVERDVEKQEISVYAVHISYDLSKMVTHYKNDKPLNALTALAGIMESIEQENDFEAHTDLGNTRTSCEWEDVSPTTALLDPEQGFAERWGAELVRDDYDLYFLAHGGTNRSIRIEHGKNLLGAQLEVNMEDLITAVKPRGVTEKGKMLYLNDEPKEGVPANPDANYIFSPNVSLYGVHATTLDCEDCTVEKGAKGVTKEIARIRMREQAQALFDDDHADNPSVTMTVNFQELGQTVEYEAYRPLENVYLWDSVVVAAKAYDIEATAQVTRLRLDVLTNQVIEVELGDVDRTGNIYSWQVPVLSGKKLRPGTVGPEAIVDESIPEEKLDRDLQDALKRARADIASAQQMIAEANQWLDSLDAQLETVTFAVGDNAGAISALQVAADEIRTAVRDAEGNISAVQQTATSLQTAMSNAQGDISTLRQTASSMSSTLSNLAGDISSLRQTATSISSTVATLDGKVQSLITQTANAIAIQLQAPGQPTARMEMVSRARAYEFGEETATLSSAGLDLFSGNILSGSLVAAHNLTTSQGTVHSVAALQSTGDLLLQSYVDGSGTGVTLFVGKSPDTGARRIMSSAQFSPFLSGEYSLGASENRWKNVYLTGSVKSSSDRLAKRDIVDLRAATLLTLLRPRAYKMREDGEAAQTRWGFVAQELKEALDQLAMGDAAVYDGSDPNNLALSYTELIAVLVEGWQNHEQRISSLEAQIEELEKEVEGR